MRWGWKKQCSMRRGLLKGARCSWREAGPGRHGRDVCSGRANGLLSRRYAMVEEETRIKTYARVNKASVDGRGSKERLSLSHEMLP